MLGVSGKSTDGIKAPFFDGTQPCRELSTDLFFPEDSHEAEKLLMVVRPICSSCKFNSSCLDWALSKNEMGIWAGTTDLDRKRIKRRTRR